MIDERPRSCSRWSVAVITPERVLSGRYKLLERLGSGGMADVYRAIDHRLRREVAVKVLRPIDGDPSFAERFRREARHAASIQHPNVAAIYDVGEDGDERYIVMELVHGDTLKDVVRRRGPLDEDEALTIAERIAQGLDAAHARGVVHRDLKPQNVLIGGDGRPRIVDFGIAKAMGGTALTSTAAVLGTAQYFAPEQAAGGSADHRSDVYSLGVVLFEMVTGKPPFDGANPIEIAMRHVRETPPRPSSWRPGLRRATDEVVLRALEKDPERRFASAAAMAAALRRARDGAGPVLAHGPASPPVRRGAFVLPAVVGLALLLAGAALARGSADRQAAVPPTPAPTVAAFTASPAPAAAAVERTAVTPTAAAVAPRVPASVASAAAPDVAVADFYGRVARRDFAGAAALWTARMQASYPPADFIDGRFAATTGLQLLRNETTSVDAVSGRATVAIDLVETTSSGTKRWAGTWQLARTNEGWLLDQPSLAAR